MRKKSDKMELGRWKAAGGQSGDESGRSGDGFDAQPRCASGFDDTLAGIADAGTAGVGDQGDLVATSEALQYFFGAFGLIELEITEQGFGDSEVFKQLTCVPGIFGGDDVAFFKGPQCA